MKLPEGIFTVPEFLLPAECADYIALSEKIGYEAATPATIDGAKLQPEIRNNNRVILDDSELVQALWLRAVQHVPTVLNGRQAIGFNERIRFYRYDPSQQFAGHVDAPFRRANGEASQLTFMIYLNQEFEGGETKFDEVEIVPKTGMALIFQHQLFHEGATIRKGRKYVLRTDVMYNPPGRFSSR
ncbi:MAG TPA: 2OG-Fe(II) oxygenase [Candidatus Limnocylindria bacterium]|nr:2OG-Fe(II) oxygenase [Candidatus Limnocylindria bacterium]